MIITRYACTRPFADDFLYHEMRLFLTITVLAICASLMGFAQEPGTGPDPATVVKSGETSNETTGCEDVTGEDSTATKPGSVFDIYWVTNCIRSGWKYSDTLLIGAGLEECDTAYPFIMPVTGKLWRGCSYYHSGWDIGLNLGDPVKAGLGGIVRFAGYSNGYGKLVIVRHFSGMEVYYAHLSKIKVSVDQVIEPGDIIGLGGATGRARGTHLHLEFRVCDRAVDIADLYTQNDTVVNLYKIKEISTNQNKPQAAQYYTVVRGDTLSGIASRNGTTVSNLATLNNINRNSILRIGQKVRVR